MSSGRLLGICLAIVCGMNIVPAHAETIKIVIGKLVFSPDQVSARVGDTIEWINNDILAHTATAKGDWDVMIPTRKSASIVLRRAGDIEYYCRFHPNMKGRIVVSGEQGHTK